MQRYVLVVLAVLALVCASLIPDEAFAFRGGGGRGGGGFRGGGFHGGGMRAGGFHGGARFAGGYRGGVGGGRYAAVGGRGSSRSLSLCGRWLPLRGLAGRGGRSGSGRCRSGRCLWRVWLLQ
jgi:hypothetical protein